MCDDVTCMCDDVTYMCDDVTYMCDDVTYMCDDVTNINVLLALILHSRHQLLLFVFLLYV